MPSDQRRCRNEDESKLLGVPGIRKKMAKTRAKGSELTVPTLRAACLEYVNPVFPPVTSENEC